MKTLKAVVAHILSEIGEFYILFCLAHDWLVKRLHSALPATKKLLRKKVFMIHGAGDKSELVYLERYVVFQSRFCRLYLHRFLRSDEAGAWHDHPWPATFLHLRNTYTEEVLVPSTKVDPAFHGIEALGVGLFDLEVRGRELLQVTTIGKEHKHRVVLDREYHDFPMFAPMTLAFSGRRYKDARGEDDWGFWTKIVPEGPHPGVDTYVKDHWKDHLRKQAPNRPLTDSH